PTDASAWQIAMVATLPSQLAIHPQASLPAAPPINTSVKANPAVVTAAPFPISRSPSRKHRTSTDVPRECRGRDLQTCQRAAVDRAQQANRRIVQAEFGLPDRQGDPDKIGISVMQEMRTTGDAQYAPFVSLCPSLVGGPDGFDCSTDCHACSNRDDLPPRLSRPHHKCMLGAAFFAYADEYLVDVKFGSPKAGRDFQRWSCVSTPLIRYFDEDFLGPAVRKEKPRSPVGGAKGRSCSFIRGRIPVFRNKATLGTGIGSAARKESPAGAGQGLIMEGN